MSVDTFLHKWRCASDGACANLLNGQLHTWSPGRVWLRTLQQSMCDQAAYCFRLAAPQPGCGVEARTRLRPTRLQDRQGRRISVIGKVPVTSDQNH